MISLVDPIVIDCQYVQPQFAAAYLLAESDRATFVENNTAHSVPILMESLKKAGLKPEQVEYLIVTHIHLDHAGGTSALAKACPQAQVLAHPKAATHLIDPTKLVKSAKLVYGEEPFERLYGTIEPIDSRRVRMMNDGEKLKWGSRKFEFLHTRGHANHHFCIYDSMSDGVFTGDTFGLAYPALQKKGLFVFPSTSPTDFDPVEARLSVSRVLETRAKRVFLTHFGEVTQIGEAANQLMDHLDFSEALLEESVRCSESDEDLDGFCEKRLRDYFNRILERMGLAGDGEVWKILKMDVQLNASGIAHVARKRRHPKPTI